MNKKLPTIVAAGLARYQEGEADNLRRRIRNVTRDVREATDERERERHLRRLRMLDSTAARRLAREYEPVMVHVEAPEFPETAIDIPVLVV